MTAYPIIPYIITIHGKQKRRIPMSQTSSMLNGILLRACTLLAHPTDHLLLGLETRQTIPSRPSSKAFQPYLKAQQAHMPIPMPRVDCNRGVSGPYSIRFIRTAQMLHLKVPFLTTSITTFTIIITHGLAVPVRRVADSPSQQRAGYGPRMVPMHLRIAEL